MNPSTNLANVTTSETTTPATAEFDENNNNNIDERIFYAKLAHKNEAKQTTACAAAAATTFNIDGVPRPPQQPNDQKQLKIATHDSQLVDRIKNSTIDGNREAVDEDAIKSIDGVSYITIGNGQRQASSSSSPPPLPPKPCVPLTTFSVANDTTSKSSLKLTPNGRQRTDRKNSLESIHSRCSTSSANDLNNDSHQSQSTSAETSRRSSPIEAQITEACKPTCHTICSPNGGPVEPPTPTRPEMTIVATRYVKPPLVDCNSHQELKGSITSDSIKKLNSVKSPAQQPEFNRKRSIHCDQVSGQKATQLATFVTGTQEHPTGGASKKRPSQVEPVRATVVRGQKLEGPFPFAGILASILGSIFFSCSVLCIKLLPDDSSSLSEKTKALFFRGVFICLFCGITMFIQRTTFLIKRDEILVNFLRCFFGFLGVFGAYIALKYISMGDSTALVFSSPVWTSLLSHFILKEPLDWIILLALPASLFGIVMIAHPALIIPIEHLAGDIERQPVLPLNISEIQPAVMFNNNINASSLLGANLSSSPNITHPLINNDLDAATMASEPYDLEHRWPGILIALGTSFMVSFVYICLKFRKSTPIQTTTFWLGVTTIFGTVLIMSFIGFGKIPDSYTEWCLLAANGTCSWVGQGLLQWALMHEDASILSVVRTLDVAMTFTLSALFLDEEILWTSIVGAIIIGLVVVSIVLNNWIRGVLRRRNEALAAGNLDLFEEVDIGTPSDHPQVTYKEPLAGSQDQAPKNGKIISSA